jgi:RNA polymerase sigma-70 factor, ECF subfamily
MATPEELTAAFLARWGHGEGAPRELGARLQELCRQARAALPGIAVDEVALAAAIAGRAPAGELEPYLERCRSAELALTLAAARGDGAAIAELERAHRATLDAVCRRYATPSQGAEDLRQILRAKLFVAEPGRAPKISDYSGQGFLENWLRVTAVRVFLDLQKRKDRAREELAGEAPVLALPSPQDLALELIKDEYRAAVGQAMQRAARQLDAGDRHMLRQHLVAGLSIDQLGSALGIHRATAARRIARAKEQWVSEIRKQLAAQLALSGEDLDDVLGLVMSRLDVSLGQVLATAP